MIISFTQFVKELKPFYNGQVFNPAIQEEYLHNGRLDTKYVEHVLEQRTTESKMRSLVNSEFGMVTFEVPELTNEVTKDTFFKHYQFGKFTNVRGWIGFFDRAHNLLLTKESLYDYILDREINLEA